ncbi:uncharacterized protein METZ01_LOCUS510498, partial [marine metagenome]
MHDLLLKNVGQTESTATSDSFGDGVREEIAVHVVSSPGFLEESSAKYSLEGVLEVLPEEKGLE